VGISAPSGITINASNLKIYWGVFAEIMRTELDGTGASSVIFDFDGIDIGFLFIESVKLY
jgi:hypothetical protein